MALPAPAAEPGPARVSLRHGRQMVAIPGPSIMPDRVLAAMARPMPDLYAGEILDVSAEVVEQLPGIARTTGRAFIVTANGHGAWEMAITNTLSAGDRVLVLESGRFAVVWGEYAAVTGVEPEVLPGDPRRAVDPAALEARLRADRAREIKAVLVAHTDTASSVRNDMSALRAALDAADHPALLMADCIASMGCDPFEMDEWGVDVALTGCQKGLMVPPGVAFVWANDRALAAHQTAGLRVGYFDWTRRMRDGAIYDYYAGTPPIAHLYGLREALSLIEEEGGIEAVWRRHRVLADAVRAAVDAWSSPGHLELNIIEPDARSNAVTTVRTGAVDVDALRSHCAADAGLTVGLGVGGVPGFRIGHMGHLNPPMLLGALGTIETALHDVGAPLGGSGVAAAAESLHRSRP